MADAPQAASYGAAPAFRGWGRGDGWRIIRPRCAEDDSTPPKKNRRSVFEVFQIAGKCFFQWVPSLPPANSGSLVGSPFFSSPTRCLLAGVPCLSSKGWHPWLLVGNCLACLVKATALRLPLGEPIFAASCPLRMYSTVLLAPATKAPRH